MEAIIMRIIRLKLVNFIGIQHGMNTNEIEINFPNNGKLITMLNGRNGSGKSTIMSQLHPFKDSFDDRRDLILPGTVGVKEIDIENGGDLYQIKHVYKKTAASFIKKNGKELNENGGVRTFNETVLNEFGLTTDYFKIGKIGSNTKNFIELTSSERKTFISRLLPKIEDYIERFNIVKEKYRKQNQDIKIVATDLGKLENEETLKSRIAIQEAEINSNTNDIESLTSQIAVLNKATSELNEKIANIRIHEIQNDTVVYTQQLDAIREVGKSFADKYGNKTIQILESEISDMTNRLGAIDAEMTSITNDRQNFNLEVVETNNEIDKKKIYLSELNTIENEAELSNRLAKLKSELNGINEQINNNPMFSYVQNDPTSFLLAIEKYSDFMKFIKEYQQELRMSSISPQKNIVLFTADNASDRMAAIAHQSKFNIEQKQELLTSKKSLLSNKLGHLDQLEILKSRPNDCDIDSCPFIANALQYKNLQSEIDDLQSEIRSIEKDLENLNQTADRIQDVVVMFKQFKAYYTDLNQRNNSIFQHHLHSAGSLEAIVDTDPTELFKYVDNVITSNAYDILNDMTTASKLSADIKNCELKYAMSKENGKIIKNVNTDIAVMEATVTKLNDKISKSTTKFSELSNEKTVLAQKLSETTAFLNGKRNFADIKKKLTDCDALLESYNSWQSELQKHNALQSSLNEQLAIKRQQKTELESQCINNKNVLFQIQKLIERKSELEETFNDTKLVRDCLDPNKGIPLYFIKSYLEKTKDITNDLLSIAFNDKFEIDFETTASDFFIKVRTGEYVKNDIVEASQGEIALATISISLALIEQSIGKFNILVLDEIDAALDAENRLNFISIIERQVAKLGLEQMFIISHNNAFDLISSNLVLCPGHSIDKDDKTFMENKTILFEME